MAGCLVLGLGVSAWPVLRAGQWQFKLPVLWHARLSPLEAANFRSWDIRALLRRGDLTESSRASLRSLAEANIMTRSARFNQSEDFAIEILSGLGERSPADEALVKHVLLSRDESAVEAAIEYFKSGSKSPHELFDIFRAALEAKAPLDDANLVEAIAALDKRDPRALAYLFRVAYGPPRVHIRSVHGAILRLPGSRRFELMMDAIARLEGTNELVPMLNAAWDDCMARDSEGELHYTLWAMTRLANMGPEVDDLWFDSFQRSIAHDSANQLYPLALRLPVAQSIRPLRELAMRSPHAMPREAFDRLIPDLTLAKLTDDELHLLRFAHPVYHDLLVSAAASQPLTRRSVWVVTVLPGKAASKLTFLRRVESDLTTTEECRVAARDALRHLGEWTDKPAAPK